MAQKRKPQKTRPANPAADRNIADHIARAKAANPPRSAEWYGRCGDLARELEIDPGDVFEQFDERAAIREYDAGVTRRDAESAAFDDVVAHFTRQTALAV